MSKRKSVRRRKAKKEAKAWTARERRAVREMLKLRTDVATLKLRIEVMEFERAQEASIRAKLYRIAHGVKSILAANGIGKGIDAPVK